MDIIQCWHCDTDTRHSKEEFYIRSDHSADYLLMFFKTPFVYKKDGRIQYSEKFHYLIHTPYAPAEHGSWQEGFVNDWIFFQGGSAKEIIDTFQLPLNTAFSIGNHSLIAPYIKEITTERKLKRHHYEVRISAIITDMLIALGRQYEHQTQISHPAFSAVCDTREYILNHVDEKITLQALAKQAQYSESRFCFLYRKFFASSPIDDLLNARIEKASSLLKYSPLSITEIATKCGFSSVHYFSKKFREKTGVSPSEYMRGK